MDTPEPGWHTLTADEALARLQSDAERGLSLDEARRRLAEHGPNALRVERRRSVAAVLARQFRSVIVLLLAVATVLAVSMGDALEAVAIGVVILVNAGVGFLTEWRAEQALDALRRQAEPWADVLRAGEVRRIAAAELVPGDLVDLSAGQGVPADGRLVACAALQIQEAALTGESVPVDKSVDAVADPEAVVAERTDLVHQGTAVTAGRGRFVVTATGAATELGRIGALVEGSAVRATPLERRLARLGQMLVVAVLAIAVVVVLAGRARGLGGWTEMVQVGLSLAIAAVPEGLPAVATMTLALGMQQMARRRALIRRLPAVETLGATTVICSDKTGTLTRNEMAVTELALPGSRVQVSGRGYAPDGALSVGEQAAAVAEQPGLEALLRAAVLCNDAELEEGTDGWEPRGDPTEAALLTLAEKAGVDRNVCRARHPRVGEHPFAPERKRMDTLHRDRDGACLRVVKGSPGTLIAASSHEAGAEGPVPLDEARRQAWQDENERLAADGLRVLALAERTRDPDGPHEDELVLLGLVAMRDPLREEAADAVARCREAGIRTIMLTGDQPATARAIARELGIGRGAEPRVVHGRELGDLAPSGWQRVVREADVFARVSPEHKLRIVEALQRDGEVVAMTGDGVNDAPALKQADIGVAMGIQGTEVAKQAAAMVITDDDFATIVGAVERGRIVYANVLKFIHFLFACNAAEILTIFLALLLGWPLPLAALQILWLNLVTDILPALALAAEPGEDGVMKRPPVDPRASLVPAPLLRRIAGQGLLIAAVSLAAYAIGAPQGHATAGTLAFVTLAIAQIFHVANVRSLRASAFGRGIGRNRWLLAAVPVCLGLQVAAVHVPVLREALSTVPLGIAQWSLVLGLALLPVLVVEVEKLVNRLRASS